MKYTFTLETGSGGDPSGKSASALHREKIVLESRAGESTRHIALKILAYLFFQGEAAPLPLEIERAVGQRHKPDLVAREPDDGPICLWIDCGQIEPKRLGRIAAANHKARIVVLKSTDGEARLYAKAAERSVASADEPRVQIMGFVDGAIGDAIDLMRGVNSLHAEARAITPQGGAVTWNGQAIDAQILAFGLSK